MLLLYRSGQAPWVKIAGSSYRDEEELRTLLVKTPEVIPLGDLQGSESTVQLTVAREAPLGSGSADLLWIDSEGRLTIVEVKLRSNPEIRREVLAQALSYAAYLQGMPIDEFIDHLVGPYLANAHGPEVAGLDLPAVFSRITGSDVEPDDFSAGLKENLETGRFRILIVVGEPHPQLKRSVSYVNGHADFEIYLVEVGFYRSEDGFHEIIAPRILDIAGDKPAGAPARSGRRRWTLDAYFDQVREDYSNALGPLENMHERLKALSEQGLIEFRFGGGAQGNLVVGLPPNGMAILWIWSSGSIQFPRLSLEQLGWSSDEVTELMKRMAEPTGMSPDLSKPEPKLVTPQSIDKAGVVDRVVEVVETVGRAWRARRQDR
ncbi:MAG: hypothetical protein ACRDWA_10430 [Acidimicrobiia bacterium]